MQENSMMQSFGGLMNQSIMNLTERQSIAQKKALVPELNRQTLGKPLLDSTTPKKNK